MTDHQPQTAGVDQTSFSRAAELEAAIDYTFTDKSLALTALTHSSVARSHNSSNERLEFLGDRILGLVIAEMLYVQFPDEDEGALGYRFPALVRAEALARIASKIGLADHLLIDNNEFATNQKRRTGVLSNACEALIAAMYLDGGMTVAEKFIQTHWQALLEEDLIPPKDAKTLLQELVQGRGLPVPVYTVVCRTGPDHAPEFTLQAQIEGEAPVNAKGPSKRAAETAAAELLYRRLTGQEFDD